MDRILTNEELEKLNSTDGIIELLCGGDKFKSLSEKEKQKLIDYTMSIDLISDWQIERNLRRSRNDNNLALLDKRRLIALSLLYFGEKDNKGRYVTYTCPYTDTVYNILDVERELKKTQSEKDSSKRLELEHIIPHSGGGGTVLFNCLISSVEANGRSEKWNFHLLDWFNQSGKKYYKPENLNRIVCYMLSAYSVAYKKYKENELEFNYDFVDGERGYTDNDDINTIPKKQIKQKEDKLLDRQNVKETDIFEYKKFLDSLVNKLKEDNYDITSINRKIKELEEQGIFKSNKKYELTQNIVEDIFKEESNDTSYLTNSLKVDYYRLVDSIEFEQEDDIRKEVMTRIDTIKSILKENNKSMKDYYLSMKDLQDIDLLYIPTNKLNDENKKIFEENIKVSFDTKINIFIDMLSEDKYTRYENGQPDNNSIFGRNNKIHFEGHKDIDGLDTRSFWSTNSSKINNRLEERFDELNSKKNKTQEEQDKLERLKKAQKAIKNYKFKNSLEERIDVFIDMIGKEEYTKYENGNPDGNNVFKTENKIKFEEYEDIDGLDTSHFWSNNSSEIKDRIEEQIKELDKKKNRTEKEQDKFDRLKKAQKAIENYEFKNSLEAKIDVFIDMLSKKEYTKYENGEPDSNNIFDQYNKIKFEGYEDIDGLDTSYFWINNSSEIKNRLEERFDELNNKENMTEEEQDKLERLEKTRIAMKYYKFKSSLEAKIDVFIDMLGKEEYTKYENGQPDNNNIFGKNNKISFEGYEDIDGLNTGFFWHSHSSEIKKRLEERLDKLNNKENKTEEGQDKIDRLKEAQIAIEKNEFKNSLEAKIDVFIDMIGKEEYTKYENGQPDNNNIFGRNNKIKFEGYEDIDGLDTSNFWNNNSSEIKDRIEKQIKELDKKKNRTEEEQDKLERLKKAQKAIKNYKFKNSLEARINVFIDMLGEDKYTSYKKGQPDNNNIFGRNNKIKFEGYEDIDGLDTRQFWNSQSSEIKKRLEERLDELNNKENMTEEEQDRLIKLKEAQIAIEKNEFANKYNLVGKIDVFIDMLSKDEYTSYRKNGRPDDNNIFGSRNEISFEGYEDIDGLDTSNFWDSNRNTHIIPLLFYNKYYDADEKKFVQSDKDYSGEEYDVARTKVLNHLKVKSIDEYVNQLRIQDKKTVKVQNLINLVQILRDKKERLTEYKDGLLEENTNLKQEIMSNMVVTNYAR